MLFWGSFGETQEGVGVIGWYYSCFAGQMFIRVLHCLMLSSTNNVFC